MQKRHFISLGFIFTMLGSLFFSVSFGAPPLSDSSVTIQVQPLGDSYYNPVIAGPKYQVISVKNNSTTQPAQFIGINLTGNSFTELNRTTSDFDPVYGHFAQCTLTANAGLNQVNPLLPGAQCIVVMTGAAGSVDTLPATGTLSFQIQAGSNVLNQTLNLTNTTYLYAGGSFTDLGSASAGNNMLLAQCTNGTCQNYFGNQTSGADNTINTLTVDARGNLYVGGLFKNLSSASAGSHYLLAQCANGTCQNYFGDRASGANNEIDALVTGSQNSLYVGGMFNSLGSAKAGRRYLLAQCADGSCQNYLGDAQSGANSDIFNLAIAPDNTLYVSGGFNRLGNATSAQNNLLLAQCNNGLCKNYFGDSISGANSPIFTMTTDYDNNVYVGGSFNTLGNASAGSNYLLAQCAYGICRNYFGNLDSGASNGIFALTTTANSVLHAGGLFKKLAMASAGNQQLFATCANGNCQNYFGDAGSGANNTIESMVADTSGILYVTGNFSNLGAASAGQHYLLAQCKNGNCQNFFGNNDSGAIGGPMKLVIGNVITASIDS